MKRFLLVSAFALLCGCGNGHSSNNVVVTPITPTRAALIGTWKYASLDTPGSSTVTCPGGIASSGEGSFVAYCGAQDMVTFNADNTYTSTVTGLDAVTVTHPSGTWELVGNILTLKRSTSNSINNSSSTITLSADGKTFSENGTSYTTTFTKL